MSKNIVIGIVILLVVAGGSFYGGMTYAKSQTPVRGQFGNGQPMGNGQLPGGGGMRGGMNGGITFGEIISKDEQSFTVKLQDGGSRIVLFSESTTVSKSTSGATSDLVVGEQVLVTGTSNQDGSVTAQNVQLGAMPRAITPPNQ